MSVFKRISKFLTPIPEELPSEQLSNASTPHDPLSAALLKPLLNALLKGEPLEELELKQNLSELKRIASVYGAYSTAVQIRISVGMMREADSGGVPYRKSRGFQLAADLYLQHIRKEINAVKTKDRPLGPTVFGDYCAELIDCLFAADRPSKGIETGLRLAESLLVEGLRSIEHRKLFMVLALQAIHCTVEESEYKSDRDQSMDNRDAIRQRKGNTPLPKPTDRSWRIDETLISYVARIEQRYDQISALLLEYDAATAVPLGVEHSGQDSSKLSAQLAFSEAVWKQAHPIGDAVFSAILLEEMGRIREELQKGGGRSSLARAAKTYEEQASFERSLSLGDLSRERLRKAHDLYLRAGDQRAADALKSQKPS